MDFGTLIFSGRPEEVRSSEVVRAAYLGYRERLCRSAAADEGLTDGDRRHRSGGPESRSIGPPVPRTGRCGGRLREDRGAARRRPSRCRRRSVVALIGANGAGKTTLLRAASGPAPARAGRVLVDGIDVTREQPHPTGPRGVCLIPEGRGIFRSLTVKENLELQMPPWIETSPSTRPSRPSRCWATGSARWPDRCPAASSRCWPWPGPTCADPRVILLDEVSMGLAPIVVDRIFESLDAAGCQPTPRWSSSSSTSTG